MVSIQEIKVQERENRINKFSYGALKETEQSILRVLYNVNHAMNAYEIYLKIFEWHYLAFEDVMAGIEREEKSKIAYKVGPVEILKGGGERKYTRDINRKFPVESWSFPLSKKLDPVEDWKEIQKLVEERKFESATKVMRKYGYEVPTYQTVVRFLSGFHKIGWVEMRIAEPYKKGFVWYLSDKIKKKIKLEIEEKLNRKAKQELNEK